jgi:hypothetical protein
MIKGQSAYAIKEFTPMYRTRIIFGLVACLLIPSLAAGCGPSAELPPTQVEEGTQIVPKPEEETPIRPEPRQDEAMPILPEPGEEEATPIASTPEQEGMSDIAAQVMAEVILRSVDGSSILEAEEPITAENVDKYRVEQEVIEEASMELAALGFEVQQVGPVSLTISGDKVVFENVFQTTLEAQDVEMATEISGAEASYYEAIAPIKVPEDLSHLIAAVVLSIPPQFFP